VKERIDEWLEILSYGDPIEILVDYVRIRFKTQDVQRIVEDVLGIKFSRMHHENYGYYTYREQYTLGDITVMVSNDILENDAYAGLYRGYEPSE